jgi:hypothetical protein
MSVTSPRYMQNTTPCRIFLEYCKVDFIVELLIPAAYVCCPKLLHKNFSGYTGNFEMSSSRYDPALQQAENGIAIATN